MFSFAEESSASEFLLEDPHTHFGQKYAQQYRLGENGVKTEAPHKKASDPIVTGTSVLGIKYKDGVMIAADTLASYGNTARFRNIKRIIPAGKYSVVGASGEYSDFQYLTRVLDETILEAELEADGKGIGPHSLHSLVTRIMYNRRNKMDPLWNTLIIAGFKDGQSYLGYTDNVGTSYEDDTVASGYGNHLARPLLRKHWRADLSYDEAKKLLEDCLRVLYYRDARALNRIQIATTTEKGTYISEPFDLTTDWSVGEISYGPEIKTVKVINTNNNNNSQFLKI